MISFHLLTGCRNRALRGEMTSPVSNNYPQDEISTEISQLLCKAFPTSQQVEEAWAFHSRGTPGGGKLSNDPPLSGQGRKSVVKGRKEDSKTAQSCRQPGLGAQGAQLVHLEEKQPQIRAPVRKGGESVGKCLRKGAFLGNRIFHISPYWSPGSSTVPRSGKYFLRTPHASLDSRASTSWSLLLKTSRRKHLWLLQATLPQGGLFLLQEAPLLSFPKLSILWCLKSDSNE